MANDDLGLLSDGDDDGHNRRRRGRSAKHRNKRIITWFVVALVLIGGGVGAYYGYQTISGIGSYDDFSGTGESDVVVEVKDGEPVAQIATTLKEQQVVASVKAFVEAGKNDDRVTSIQPGFYLMKTRMSGDAAVERMVDPTAKVTPLEVRGGNILYDITAQDNSITKGILSRMADGSCANLDGQQKCVSVAELRDVAENADLAALGIPEWALSDVAKAPKENRLEGLILPGLYHLKPGVSALELMRSVLATSMMRMQSYGIPGGTKETGFRPYEVLTVASLVEKEGITADFSKVARVIYNRLPMPQRLELDSTINYKLNKPDIVTSDEDRARADAYNTYNTFGLPPTPIGSPSRAAIAAANNAEAGTWLYFVKCDKTGTSCFSDNHDEHMRLVAKARAEGVF